MGKIRTRVIGLEDVEEKQKKEQKTRSEEKKAVKTKEKKIEEAATVEVKTEEKKPAKKVTAVKKAKVHVRGKKYSQAKNHLDKKKIYKIEEAVELLKKMKYTRFDESVEFHLNVDETGRKGEAELPYPTGKTLAIKIVDDTVITDIEKGKFDFDILITHPSFMPKLARFAKVLGPKGLMPNPKAGTISAQPEEVAKKFAKGALRWKTEPKFPLIHQMIGKVSHENKNLVANAEAFLTSVGKNHIVTAYLKTTMSPAVRIDLEKE